MVYRTKGKISSERDLLMDRAEFINQVFIFFKSKDEELKRAYDLAFTVKENIDWNKLYNIVINEAETRYLPAPKWFKDYFNKCIIYDKNNYSYDGIKLRLWIKDKKHPTGYPYEYETIMNNLTLDAIKMKMMQKWEDKFIKLELWDDDTLLWNKV